jgi:hypothetical protein
VATGVSVPEAPRAMLVGATSTLESLLEQIEKDKTTKLYPRLALFEALAVFKDKRRPREIPPSLICEQRREFLDSFAYLCDVKKGGKTVTATALQALPNSDFLWIAANEGIHDDVWEYATNILQLLKTVTSANEGDVKHMVFELAVAKCRPRIQYYKDEVQKYARICRMALRRRIRDDVGMESHIAVAVSGLPSK